MGQLEGCSKASRAAMSPLEFALLSLFMFIYINIRSCNLGGDSVRHTVPLRLARW